VNENAIESKQELFLEKGAMRMLRHMILGVAVAIAVVGFVSGAAYGTVIAITNADFENVGPPAPPNWPAQPLQAGAVYGWTGSQQGTNQKCQYGTDLDQVAISGSTYGMKMWKGTAGPTWIQANQTLSQTIGPSGWTYTLTVLAIGGAGGFSETGVLYLRDVTAGTTLGSASLALGGYQDAWQTLTVTYTVPDVSPPPSTNVLGIRLEMTTGSGTGKLMFDNVQLDYVPEPAAMSLLGIGGLSLLLRRRRR